MKKLIQTLNALLLALVLCGPTYAQTGTPNWGGNGTAPIWDTSGIVGHGAAETCANTGEVFTAAQGGCPPFINSGEPAPINETVSLATWSYTVPAGTCIEGDPANAHYGQDTGCRPYHDEDKFRTECSPSHRSQADPILAPGNPVGPHLHDFCGNATTDQNSTYASLRMNTFFSTTAGAVLNPTGYWHPSLLYQIKPGVWVPVNFIRDIFYYSNPGTLSPKLVRIPRSLNFIAGVNPADRFNTARQQELTNSGLQWDMNDRHNGWNGWSCVVKDGAPAGTPAPTLSATASDPVNGADINPLTGLPRQLVNNDGSSVWVGCEGPNYWLEPSVSAPDCYAGNTFSSTDGRSHMRYAARMQDNSFAGCPRGSWRVPTFLAKTIFPAFTSAIRAKMKLASDMTNPPGSTWHADWMGAWDYRVMLKWMLNCNGLTINGVTRTGGSGTNALARTCATYLYDDNTYLKDGVSPDLTKAQNPIVSFIDLAARPKREQFGPVLPGAVVNATMAHMH